MKFTHLIHFANDLHFDRGFNLLIDAATRILFASTRYRRHLQSSAFRHTVRHFSIFVLAGYLRLIRTLLFSFCLFSDDELCEDDVFLRERAFSCKKNSFIYLTLRCHSGRTDHQNLHHCGVLYQYVHCYISRCECVFVAER